MATATWSWHATRSTPGWLGKGREQPRYWTLYIFGVTSYLGRWYCWDIQGLHLTLPPTSTLLSYLYPFRLVLTCLSYLISQHFVSRKHTPFCRQHVPLASYSPYPRCLSFQFALSRSSFWVLFKMLHIFICLCYIMTLLENADSCFQKYHARPQSHFSLGSLLRTSPSLALKNAVPPNHYCAWLWGWGLNGGLRPLTKALTHFCKHRFLLDGHDYHTGKKR